MRPRMRLTRSLAVDGALARGCARGLPSLRARVGVCHDGRSSSSSLTGILFVRDVDALTLEAIAVAEGDSTTAALIFLVG